MCPALTPARQVGTRFTYPGGMGGYIEYRIIFSIRTTLPSAHACRLEICKGTGIVGIRQNPWEICRNWYNCCGNTAGMELRLAGILEGWNLLLRKICSAFQS